VIPPTFLKEFLIGHLPNEDLHLPLHTRCLGVEVV